MILRMIEQELLDKSLDNSRKRKKVASRNQGIAGSANISKWHAKRRAERVQVDSE